MAVTAFRTRDVRVLIVEDEPLVRMLLTDLVEDAGFCLAGAAASAPEALRIADAAQPDIAIVDVNLRGARDGLKAGAELARRGVSIILISGQMDLGACTDVRALEPVAVLSKPFLPAQIVAALVGAARTRPERVASPD